MVVVVAAGISSNRMVAEAKNGVGGAGERFQNRRGGVRSQNGSCQPDQKAAIPSRFGLTSRQGIHHDLPSQPDWRGEDERDGSCSNRMVKNMGLCRDQTTRRIA